MGFAESLADAANAAQKHRHSNLFDKSLFEIEIILLLSVFAIFVSFGRHGMTDSKYSMLLTENLLHHRSFEFEGRSMPRLAPFARPGYQQNGYPYQIEETHGKVLYAYPVGSSVLSIPFVAALNFAGVSARSPDGSYNEDGEELIQRIIAALLMASLTVVFFRTAHLLLPLSWSIVLALGGAFSTQIWSTASRVLWSHTWQLFLIGLAIYVLLEQDERQSRGRPIILATVLSLAYFVRPTSSIPIAAITGYVLIFRRKNFLALALTGGAWLMMFVAYSWIVSGQPLPSYYLFHLSSDHFWEAIAGDLISPSRGLFVYVPSTAFVLLLLGYYWRMLSDRPLVVLSLIVIVVHTCVVATDPNWWGGHCYGARMTIDSIPWFFLLAVFASRGLQHEHRSGAKKFAVTLGVLTLVVGAAINGRGALSQSANDWVNGPPADVDQMPQRVWDWSHPQFLAWTQRAERDRTA